MDALTFVDIETTGARVMYDRVIEIGILRVENDRLVKTYQTLINPESYISPFIEQLTGIETADLTDAPTFDDVKYTILELLEGSVFVAHNVRFDYGFLKNEFQRHGITYASKHFCTAKLSRMLFPQHRHHNLDSIVSRFQFEINRRHRAYDDAQVLWDFYKAVKKMFPPEHLEQVFARVLKRPSTPVGISSDEIEALPETPGVYTFYDEENMPLYVGKSINIRERVMSHFASDHSSNKEMNISRLIRRIETVRTCGELGALLLESAMVKELQPLYNRQLRNSRLMVLLVGGFDEHGYRTISIVSADHIDVESIDSVYGVFRSVRQAKDALRGLVKEYGLCDVKLGLDTTRGRCFSHQLGWCKGPCAGKIDTQAYNDIFDIAFESMRIARWPYTTPVVISERRPDMQTNEYFVVDKWCLLNHYREDDVGTHELMKSDYRFDLDTYKILRRFVTNHAKQVKPMPITQYPLSAP